MPLTFRPLDEAGARAILTWRYEAPYDLYNLDSGDMEASVRFFLDPQNGYQAVVDGEGDLVAYCCFGLDAQVPGGDYGVDALDVGLGVRPDLIGQGRGFRYVEAVLSFAQHTFAPGALRVTVAEFNQRARRVWQKAGFQPVQRFLRQQDNRPFVTLMRHATVGAQYGDSQ
jgi:ribosomal-protein-alanine N-acetyltransferase